MRTADLTASDVRAAFDYEPETGNLIWKTGRRAGRVAGCLHRRTGYLFITFRRSTHLAHRIVWLHVNGALPDGDLDHRSLVKTDNRIGNLRECDDSTNQANTPMRPTNTSGRKGVCWNKSSGKWQAGIKRGGRSFHLGLFTDLEEAAQAYLAAAARTYGEFARAE